MDPSGLLAAPAEVQTSIVRYLARKAENEKREQLRQELRSKVR